MLGRCFAFGSEGSSVTQPSDSSQAVSYVLSPEDQLSVHVIDLDDLSDKPVRIDPNGFIDLPLVGTIHAAGMTVEQLRSVLVKKLTKYITAPRININVLEYHSRPVSVLGAVNSPGVHQLQGPKRLLEVISLAGGWRSEAGPRLVITRQMKQGVLPLPNAHVDASGQFSVAEVSTDGLVAGQNPAENILIKPNDVISVPRADLIYVLGQVKKAGGFPLTSHDGISLLNALALAEGLDRDAAPKKARIVHQSGGKSVNLNEVTVNLQQILDGKAPDIQLHANDVLFVPNNLAKSTTRRALEAALQIGTGVLIYR